MSPRSDAGLLFPHNRHIDDPYYIVEATAALKEDHPVGVGKGTRVGYLSWYRLAGLSIALLTTPENATKFYGLDDAHGSIDAMCRNGNKKYRTDHDVDIRVSQILSTRIIKVEKTAVYQREFKNLGH